MSHRNARRAPAGDMFPGMPDQLTKRPPKAGAGDHVARTLDEAIARSHEILTEALDAYPVVGTFWLSSGGGDSGAVGHLMRGRFDAVLHVNTGTGIPATTQYVHDVAAAWGDTLHELHPKNAYADLVRGKVIATTGPNKGIRPVWKGFPGPAGHKVMYRHLKDEPLMRFRRSIVGNEGRTRKIIYLSGMRWAETERRFRNAEAIDPDGAIIWVSPLVHWTDAHMREYRARYRCQQPHEHAAHRLCFDEALPLNEVTEHLHMSGECLCGAYAKPGELDEIEFFYPQTAARLRALERAVEAEGIPACKWGRKPPNSAQDSGPAGRLCSNCVPLEGQTDLLADWREAGLITTDQYDTFTRHENAA
ncbi:phosphoadenosine phosphosulfate reductase family protein [Streptomyces sp. 2133.1]|uniref:phosphoadenosine phosphosulfate reductase family protein n=1 Tax=Streptomyces sp. 2133.1 TaxID=1881021 RepID=UPI00089D0E7C|nr:phosphoadenosine phosphosulfate reductase family protein [Streptomyces sp. 2133.1]SED08398.1 3'-phosphoadenosine 5'-phosphosulfate sulfotransferase (PAPS reductase)/FAD synthetase [Streptomyces sp. 2133.1]